MKKVFGILCHKVTNPLVFTVNYLSSFPENEVIIHVDAKSDLDEFTFLSNNNVFFLKERVSVNWGGVSQIEAEINLLRKAHDVKCEYFFLISGDDIPCKTNDEMNVFLESIGKKNIVHYDGLEIAKKSAIERVKYRYPGFFFKKEKDFLDKVKCRVFKIIRFFFVSSCYSKASLENLVFFKGSNWISLNYESIDKLVDFIKCNPWYFELFKHSFCCDEVFFHTALIKAGVIDFYVDDNNRSHDFRYIDWNSGPDYPRILNVTDLSKISQTDDFFARKFAPDTPHEVLKNFVG